MAYLKEASRTIKVADHMISVTYPLVKDTKLLLAILENVYLTLTNSIAALAYYDRDHKRVPPFQDKFDSIFNVFAMRSAPMYKISPVYIEMVQDIQSMIKEHKKSPIEFARKDKFIICSDTYNIKSLSLEQINKYVTETKKFKEQIEVIITENERNAS